MISYFLGPQLCESIGEVSFCESCEDSEHVSAPFGEEAASPRMRSIVTYLNTKKLRLYVSYIYTTLHSPKQQVKA